MLSLIKLRTFSDFVIEVAIIRLGPIVGETGYVQFRPCEDRYPQLFHNVKVAVVVNTGLAGNSSIRKNLLEKISDLFLDFFSAV